MPEIRLGITLKSKNEFDLELEQNTPGSLNTNMLFLTQQGGGKTNMLMLTTFYLYNEYIKTAGEYGALPIIFSPLFEFDRLLMASEDHNLPYNEDPQKLNIASYTFTIAEPPPVEHLRIITFRFKDLTVEEIASFAGYQDNKSVLGNIDKLITRMRRRNPYYTIDDFINEVEQDKSLYDALYYVFKKLNSGGLFDDTRPSFDWFEAIKEQKPIVFNFGSINTRDLYSSITAILLRRLWELGYEYDTAISKKFRIEQGSGETLTEREEFLVKYFYLALIFEESHQIFWNTTSRQLQSFPAHYIYSQISDLLGRKKGFKYNILVTQLIMELYLKFRKQSKYLFLGSTLYEDDKLYLVKDMRFPKKHVPIITNLPKYGWAVISVQEYRKRRKNSVNLIRSFRSPAGQPKMRN